MESAPPVRDRFSRRTALIASLAGVAAAGAVRLPAALAQGATPVASPVTDANEASFLFVQAGFTAGTLADNGDGTHALTLSTAPAQTVFFSDRPERIVGAVDTQRALDMLGFDGDDPPNAALVFAVNAEETDIIVLELTGPAYDAGSATLTFTATVLEGIDQLTGTSVGFEEAPLTSETIPTEFGAASLFIDSVMGCTPWDPRC
jgi:hypothetical protein